MRDLLALLIAEAPRVVRKDELHQRLWPGTFVSDATLVGLIKEVRRALDDHDGEPPLIRTAHGVGCALAGELRRPDSIRLAVSSMTECSRGRRLASRGQQSRATPFRGWSSDSSPSGIIQP
jgi:DNA-binding winged helix-turn-helix (wHTH) protein